MPSNADAERQKHDVLLKIHSEHIIITALLFSTLDVLNVGGSTSMGQTGPTGTDDDTALPVTKKVTFASIVEKARREEKRKPKKD